MNPEDACIRDERLFPRVAAQVKDIERVEILGEMLAHAVKRLRVQKTVVRDERDDALFADAFRCPFDSFHIQIVERTFVCCYGVLRVGFLDEFVQCRILAVSVPVMLIRLSDVIRWVADDDEHG